MKDTSPTGHTIRFRRWSRKAYAVFASIGRYVTIGCLRKNVADRSLSKQKVAGNAGDAGCREESPWKGKTDGKESDTGIPPGSGNILTSLFTELRKNELILFEVQVASHVNTWGESYTYTLQQESTKQKNTREQENTTKNEKDKRYGLPGILLPIDSCTAPAIRTSFFMNVNTKSYDNTEIERTGTARQLPQ